MKQLKHPAWITQLAVKLGLGVFTLTRIILLFYTGAHNIPIQMWPMILIKGLFFDAAMLAYLMPPFILADAFLPMKIKSNPRFIALVRIFLTGLVFFLLFLCVIEIVFWVEFHTRLNFIALD